MNTLDVGLLDSKNKCGWYSISIANPMQLIPPCVFLRGPLVPVYPGLGIDESRKSDRDNCWGGDQDSLWRGSIYMISVHWNIKAWNNKAMIKNK